MNNDTCIALDLGGTKLLIGEVTKDGRVLRSKRYSTGYLTQAEELKRICECLDDYIETVGFALETPTQMGIGMIGHIDSENGVWLMIDQRRNEPTPIAEVLARRYNMECHIENDVKAATIAERCFGSGGDTEDFIYINIGTGIAAGFYIGGKLIRGWQNDSGEVGHMTANSESDIVCFCGRRGCVESLASGYGLQNCCEKRLEKYPDTALKADIEAKTVTVQRLFELEKSDLLAELVLHEAQQAIADLLVNLLRVTNPQKIILGGGVVADGKMLESVLPLISELRCMKSLTRGICISTLDPQIIGLIGAAAVGFCM